MNTNPFLMMESRLIHEIGEVHRNDAMAIEPCSDDATTTGDSESDSAFESDMDSLAGVGVGCNQSRASPPTASFLETSTQRTTASGAPSCEAGYYWVGHGTDMAPQHQLKRRRPVAQPLPRKVRFQTSDVANCVVPTRTRWPGQHHQTPAVIVPHTQRTLGPVQCANRNARVLRRPVTPSFGVADSCRVAKIKQAYPGAAAGQVSGSKSARKRLVNASLKESINEANVGDGYKRASRQEQRKSSTVASFLGLRTGSRDAEDAENAGIRVRMTAAPPSVDEAMPDLSCKEDLDVDAVMRAGVEVRTPICRLLLPCWPEGVEGYEEEGGWRRLGGPAPRKPS